MLTGNIDPLTLDQELSQYPDYDGHYQADANYVAALSKTTTLTHIVVIIGTWCPDCHRDIPRFMKVLAAANNANISVDYIGVDKHKVDPQGACEDYLFTRLPTYIVIQNNNEIGRITERPETTLEQDLAKILSQ